MEIYTHTYAKLQVFGKCANTFLAEIQTSQLCFLCVYRSEFTVGHSLFGLKKAEANIAQIFTTKSTYICIIEVCIYNVYNMHIWCSSQKIGCCLWRKSDRWNHLIWRWSWYLLMILRNISQYLYRIYVHTMMCDKIEPKRKKCLIHFIHIKI